MTNSREDQAATAYASIVKTALIVAVFTLIVLGLLIANHYQLRTSDPRNSPELKTLKAQLHKHPRDEGLKQQIRRVDLRLRKEHLGRIDFAQTGNYLLLVGVVGLLILIPAAAQYRKKIVLPDKESDDPDELRRAAVLNRRAVAALGAVIVIGFVFLAVTSRGDLASSYAKVVREYEKNPPPSFDKPGDPLAGLPPAMLQNLVGRPVASAGSGDPRTATLPIPSGVPATPPVLPQGLPGLVPANPLAVGVLTPSATPPKKTSKPSGLAPEAAFDSRDYAPSADDYAGNWPGFRGPACGLAEGSYPTSWDAPAGKSLLWKAEIPLPGWNSPVVWKDRVFLAGADKNKREVYCFAADSGKLLWKRAVATIAKGKTPEVSDDTGYAAPTMAVDGKRVFAIFPNGDVVCYSFDGKRLWGRNLGSPESMYGYASSLATFRSLLIVQYDQGSGDDGKSVLLALQGATGKIVWVARRPVANSWSSPAVVRTGDQGIVITNANPWSIAYDALSGRELWRANLMSGDVAPSPAFANGIAYVCNSGAVLAAIRAGGKGDITKTHVAWQASDGLPDITSPSTNGQQVFLLTTEGTATCYDAKQGKKLWEHSFEDTAFLASPVIVGNRVYMLDEKGVMHVIAANGAFREEARSPLGEEASATPAFVDGRIYIRGTKHLFCIGGSR